MSSSEEPKYDWLSDAFLQTIVRNQLQQSDFVIKSYDITSATEKGENFLGTVFRAKVEIEHAQEQRSLNFIIKAQAGDDMDEVAQAFQAYKREVEMYTTVLPAMQMILQNAGIDIVLGPKCYYIKATDVLVLEDLKERGMEMKDRIQGLDLEHTKKTLETLAAFHAASMVYLQKVFQSRIVKSYSFHSLDYF